MSRYLDDRPLLDEGLSRLTWRSIHLALEKRKGCEFLNEY
jgi:hypothetical protein